MPNTTAADNTAVIVISSHVVRGSVGNRAAVFALETLGHPVWAVPTVILPWHTGHGPAGRIVPEVQQFKQLMEDMERAPWLGEVGAVLTGYLGNAEQAKAGAKLIKAIKARNPQALYLCDPVIGDREGLYVPEATAAAIRDELLPLADIATPNRFELVWLSGVEPENNEKLMETALDLGPSRMLVTSSFGMLNGSTGNLLLTDDHAYMAEHRHVEGPTNGMGDLTAALFLARILDGMTDEKALQTTTASVFEIMVRAAKRGADELMLEADAASLSSPMAMVQMRQLMHPGKNLRA